MSHDSTAKTPSTDPIDPPSASDFDDLKLPQDFDSILHATRILTACPLRRPAKHDWIRVHPTWSQPAPVLKLAGERDELWILKNALVPGIPSDLVVSMVFVPFITRQGAISMWPLRIPATGRADTWATTALSIADIARTTWVQVHSDQKIGAYVYLTTTHSLDEPDWTTATWAQLRELAFRSKLIDSLDHPILVAVLQGK